MKIKSKILPIRMKDIDTDLIIPADYLKGTSRSGLGQFLFKRLRDGDEGFVMNLARYAGAEVIVALDNFGCGSSREHAAWALADYGIRVVIAPSFADIFKTNTLKNGIVLVEVDAEIVERIFAMEEALGEDFFVEVDLPEQRVVLPGGEIFDFAIDPYTKECLVKGMDDLDYLLSCMKKIEVFDQRRKEKLFFNIEAI